VSEVAAGRPQLRFDVSSGVGGKPARRRRQPATRSGVLRVALTRSEAAEALGVSLDSFERYVQPEIRLVRRNSIRLVPVGELERWVEQNAAPTLEEGR
jgi:hypothetical protein